MSYLEQLKSRKALIDEVSEVSKPIIGTFGTGSTRHIPNILTDSVTLHTQLPEIEDNEASTIFGFMDSLAKSDQEPFITPQEVLETLALEDIEDWRKGAINNNTLTAFAQSLLQRREMDEGICPTHYTEHAICERCGPIWLWFSGRVQGCPWCWNQANNKPIPRPCSINCGNCHHFTRTDHPNLGHCSNGEPEATAGLWDTDSRYCEQFYPNSHTGDK